jgi:hypothetical protein
MHGRGSIGRDGRNPAGKIVRERFFRNVSIFARPASNSIRHGVYRINTGFLLLRSHFNCAGIDCRERRRGRAGSPLGRSVGRGPAMRTSWRISRGPGSGVGGRAPGPRRGSGGAVRSGGQGSAPVVRARRSRRARARRIADAEHRMANRFLPGSSERRCGCAMPAAHARNSNPGSPDRVRCGLRPCTAAESGSRSPRPERPAAVARRVPKGRDRVIRHVRARYRFLRWAARANARAGVHRLSRFGLHPQRRTRSGRDRAPEGPVPSRGSAMRLALARRNRRPGAESIAFCQWIASRRFSPDPIYRIRGISPHRRRARSALSFGRIPRPRTARAPGEDLPPLPSPPTTRRFAGVAHRRPRFGDGARGAVDHGTRGG